MTISGPTRAFRGAHLLAALLLVWAAGPVGGQDLLTVGSVALAEPGQALVIPVSLRDVSGTQLDVDAGSGRTIQSLALTIQISPPGSVANASIARAGIAAVPAPLFETQTGAGYQRTLVMTFDETGDPLTPILDAPSPGDLIAEISLQVDPGFDFDTIELELVRTATALGNQQGTAVETRDNGRLTLVDGSIRVDSSSIFVNGFESGDTTSWSSTVP